MADLSAWRWDETLYAGSAEHYAAGRMPYPTELADTLRDELGLDGGGRLLDVGCGPGNLTLLLAPLFAEAVGIDADEGMVRVARLRARPGTRFAKLRAEQLPADLGTFRVASFAQSFHWLEGEKVARLVRSMLEPGGALVHVGATTHEGEGNVPHDEIRALVGRWLGSERRAGRGVRAWDGEDPREAIDRSGFRGRREVEVPRGETFERSEDAIVAAVFSLSAAAPHLFGDRVGEFEAELRALLRGRGPFHERPRGITLTIWSV